MKIKEIKTEYYEASGKVSDLIRQLDFAGIAVIWIFKTGKESAAGIHYSNELLWPLILFVVSLAFDLAQYVYKAAYLGILNHRSWKRYHDDEKVIPLSEKRNWPTIICFWAKTILVCVGFAFLLAFLFRALEWNQAAPAVH
jgi:hypothetical protein